MNNKRNLDTPQIYKARNNPKTETKFAVLSSYKARYFPSLLMDIMEAGFLSSLLCPILFHVLISQTAVTALSPV